MRKSLFTNLVKNKNSLLYSSYCFLGVNGFALLHHQLFNIPSTFEKHIIPSFVGIFLGGWVGKLLDDKDLIIYREKKKISKLVKKLKEQSSIDGLTKILNRRVFDETIKNKWEIYKRSNFEYRINSLKKINKYKKLSVLMIDIDYFKQFNDSYGHQKGDIALKEVALAIKNSLEREIDITARYGGEEFITLLSETNKTGLENIVKKIQKNISDLEIPHLQSKISQKITVSIGGASLIPLDQENSYSQLIKNADDALYFSKKNGRNKYTFYDSI